MKTLLVGLGSGLLFGGGLVLSGMTDPRRIQAFLALTEGWDPSLLVVMAAAVAVHALVLRVDARRAAGVGSSAPSGKIDQRLVAGAAVFGVGWGLTGYCPGPAVVSVGAMQTQGVVFFSAMLAGIAAYHLIWARLTSSAASEAEERQAGSPAETLERAITRGR